MGAHNWFEMLFYQAGYFWVYRFCLYDYDFSLTSLYCSDDVIYFYVIDKRIK